MLKRTSLERALLAKAARYLPGGNLGNLSRHMDDERFIESSTSWSRKDGAPVSGMSAATSTSIG